MTPAEQVTTFGLHKIGKAGTEPATYRDLCKALTRHCKDLGIEAEEYGIDAMHWEENTPLPKRFRWYVAFAVEGNSEGYYVHVGVMQMDEHGDKCGHENKRHYVNIGLAKMYTADLAYRMATECQRFLTAMLWN